MTPRRWLFAVLLALLATPAFAQRHAGGGGGWGGGGGGGGFHSAGRPTMSAGTRSFGTSIGRPSFAAPTMRSQGFVGASRPVASPQSPGSRGISSRVGPTSAAPFTAGRGSPTRVVPNNRAPGVTGSRLGPTSAAPLIASRGSPTSGVPNNRVSGGMISNRYTPSPVRAAPTIGRGLPAAGLRTAAPASGTFASRFTTTARTGANGTFTNRRAGIFQHRNHFRFGFNFGFGFGSPFCFRGPFWCWPSLFWWSWPYYWAPYTWAPCYEPATWWWPAGVYQPSYVYHYYRDPGPIVVAEQALPPAAAANSHVALGDSLFKQGRFAEAADAYRQAQQANPGDASIDLLLADAVFATGDYHQAAFLIGGALRRQPDLARANPDKRSAYGDAKQFDAQLTTLQKYTAEHPYDAMAQLLLGYNLKLAGKADESRQALRRLLEIDPDNQAAKLLLEEPPAADGQPAKNR
ncbi:MAG TPA: tetratricopeptide repeat protein [Planctomycetota bacterium]|nr:tetratricopeptide repeat protein [Planctomycetota bacterium]